MAACGGGGGAEGRVRVDLDKDDPERLLRYYLGGYAAPDGADPFDAGLVAARDGDFLLDPDALAAVHPDAAAALQAAAPEGAMDWDAFADWVQGSYYAARDLPPTLAALRDETGYRTDPDAWFSVVLDGVMTTARRHLFVPVDAVRAALRGSADGDGRLLYPVGTTIVGEHRDGGEVVETTLMRKRGDGFWDFAVYGADGDLAPGTSTEPRALAAPTQCVGCHFGTRRFEPEKSFPAVGPPGPHGPRVIHAPDVEVDPALVRRFDEHARRSDTVLGLYATLYVAELQARRADGTLAPEDADLLAALDL